MSSWTKEKTLLLIEKIRVSNVWDIKSKEYKDTNKRKGIYSAIGEVLNFTASEIESKWHTVKSQFSRELSKVLASHKSGSGVEDVYCPSWYAYGSLQFLRDTNRPHIIRTTSEETQEESYPTNFGTMSQEQLSLCWDNFHINMSSGINSLLVCEDLVDVTLAVDGQYLKAHKMILSVCSPYFRTLFSVNPCKHPIVFMKDISYSVMNDLLTFMYQGEVQVNQENLDTFIKTAEALEIKGLAGDNKKREDVLEGVKPKRPTQQLKTKNIRKQSAPSPMKKSKLSLSSVETETIVPPPINPKILIQPEFVSTTNNINNCADLRTQNYNSTMKNLNDDFDGNQIEGELDRTENFNIAKEKEDRDIIPSASIDPTIEIKPEFVSSTDINNCINIKMEPCDDSLEGEITDNSFEGGGGTDFIEEALDSSFMEVMEETQPGTSDNQGSSKSVHQSDEVTRLKAMLLGAQREAAEYKKMVEEMRPMAECLKVVDDRLSLICQGMAPPSSPATSYNWSSKPPEDLLEEVNIGYGYRITKQAKLTLDTVNEKSKWLRTLLVAVFGDEACNYRYYQPRKDTARLRKFPTSFVSLAKSLYLSFLDRTGHSTAAKQNELERLGGALADRAVALDRVGDNRPKRRKKREAEAETSVEPAQEILDPVTGLLALPTGF